MAQIIVVVVGFLFYFIVVWKVFDKMAEQQSFCYDCEALLTKFCLTWSAHPFSFVVAPWKFMVD